MIRKLIAKVYRMLFNKEQIGIYTRLCNYNYSVDDKHKYQILKLKEVLKVALSNVPFYRSYDLNLDDLDYEEFQKLPVISKDTIRNKDLVLVNKSYIKDYTVVTNTSGGSTGEPVTFYQTIKSQHHGIANFYYANYLNGVSPYDRTVDFWGALRDMNHTGEFSIRAYLKEFLQNKKVFNTYVLDKKRIDSYIHNINKFRPSFIKAYVHSLYDISKYINKNNITIKVKPIIHTTTGPLYPEMRQEISRAFNNASVFSFYGSREVSAIATEIADQEGMHVMYDNVFVEVLDDEGKPVSVGDEGEIVITTLNNFYMPLIRYRIGDRGIKGDNNFGTLLIRNVLGRTLGVIYKKDGGYVDGQYFTTLFFNLDTVKGFQIVQKNINQIQLNIVKNVNFREGDLDDVINNIKQQLGIDVEVVIQYCDKINLTATGKIMYVYSEIKSE